MNSWHSYPEVFALGHRAVEGLLGVDLLMEEKVDGSQFSFGYDDEKAVLRFRSKNQEIHQEDPPNMFAKAVDFVKSIQDQLHPGWTYRGECLDEPKHNALQYSRVPVGNVILFDVSIGNNYYLPYQEKQEEAARLGLDWVPALGVWEPSEGRDVLLERIKGLLDRESVLGGTKIEGVVLKPLGYNLFGRDKKVLMGKFVSEAYKEVHRSAWGEANPGGKDIVRTLITMYKTEARWQKAIQHMEEAGILQHAPQDIGPLLEEITLDVKKEEEGEIKQVLFSWAWPQIHRAITAGFPQWYKERIMKEQLEEI